MQALTYLRKTVCVRFVARSLLVGEGNIFWYWFINVTAHAMAALNIETNQKRSSMNNVYILVVSLLYAY